MRGNNARSFLTQFNFTEDVQRNEYCPEKRQVTIENFIMMQAAVWLYKRSLRKSFVDPILEESKEKKFLYKEPYTLVCRLRIMTKLCIFILTIENFLFQNVYFATESSL